MTEPAAPRRWRRWLGQTVLLLWAPCTLCLTAFLMVDHVAPLPPPGAPDVVAAAAALAVGSGPGVVHVIYESCSCTDRLVASLLEREPRKGWAEHIVYVGSEDDRMRSARRRGYLVSSISRDTLRQQWALDAAPVLVVKLAHGGIGYLGGYYRYPAAIHPLHDSLIARVAAGEQPRGLPVFGCAVAERLAQQRDPFGLRNWR